MPVLLPVYTWTSLAFHPNILQLIKPDLYRIFGTALPHIREAAKKRFFSGPGTKKVRVVTQFRGLRPIK